MAEQASVSPLRTPHVPPLIDRPTGCYCSPMTQVFDIGDHARLLERFFTLFAQLRAQS